ncbi:TIGR00266 family protein [Bradymonas sediminis]|uniref:TIGR00266 family protein n=1 Tax=Bradymonas sediminis TaxID=1548548 RepID=A0A2Z4FMW8_9DELT|nr:TIGR00266 family protein [Bradymonas sediminis]AWV90283.1 TIGR00266 family protein [Bradymonas sediminis]TDP75749.1 uncharacterized protein (TIGR00266 family) [Bradymonas sediminis]
MKYEILSNPNFAIAKILFEQIGEQLVVEASAMVAKSTDLQMKTGMRGGLMGAAKRKLLGGESLFQNTFTATTAGETLWVAPPGEGDMISFDMDGSEPVFMSSDNFVASGPNVELDTKWQGGKGFFSGTSVFMLRADGIGPLFVGSYGGIHAIQVGPEGYIVDNNHIVAFTGGLDYQIRTVGGLKSFFGGGEGYVCEFRGQGTLWVSTRSADALAKFVHPFRQTKSN